MIKEYYVHTYVYLRIHGFHGSFIFLHLRKLQLTKKTPSKPFCGVPIATADSHATRRMPHTACHISHTHLTPQTQLYQKRTKLPKWRAYENGAEWEERDEMEKHTHTDTHTQPGTLAYVTWPCDAKRYVKSFCHSTADANASARRSRIARRDDVCEGEGGQHRWCSARVCFRVCVCVEP